MPSSRRPLDGLDGAVWPAEKGCAIPSRRATTNKIAWAFPTALGRPGTITWVRQARWVHDGKFSTAAGEWYGRIHTHYCATGIPLLMAALPPIHPPITMNWARPSKGRWLPPFP